MERLPAYLRAIDSLLSHGVVLAPSTVLAERAGVSSAQFRKDISLLGGISGTRGSGYVLSALRSELRLALGSSERIRFVIVGAGNLGTALASSDIFRRGGLDLVGLFDVSPARVGCRLAGLEVLHDRELAGVIAALDVSIVVIATPPDVAQSVASEVVGAGAREILNFSSAVLQVSEDVEVRSVDFGVELQMLALHARMNRT